mmetsp:Transcript_2457/g.6578  ORF Transcript_2457/g.6578 Transcript_2457/m.6578 type:complete len:367 (-) Transcript_2457:663-1763(-)
MNRNFSDRTTRKALTRRRRRYRRRRGPRDSTGSDVVATQLLLSSPHLSSLSPLLGMRRPHRTNRSDRTSNDNVMAEEWPPEDHVVVVAADTPALAAWQATDPPMIDMFRGLEGDEQALLSLLRPLLDQQHPQLWSNHTTTTTVMVLPPTASSSQPPSRRGGHAAHEHADRHDEGQTVLERREAVIANDMIGRVDRLLVHDPRILVIPDPQRAGPATASSPAAGADASSGCLLLSSSAWPSSSTVGDGSDDVDDTASSISGGEHGGSPLCDGRPPAVELLRTTIAPPPSPFSAADSTPPPQAPMIPSAQAMRGDTARIDQPNAGDPPALSSPLPMNQQVENKEEESAKVAGRDANPTTKTPPPSAEE